MKKAKRKNSEKLFLINFKVTEAERIKLQELADRFTRGNMSELLRQCALRYAKWESSND